ncbi:hypothetical protein PoB_007324000 [Plakobranchus ocellatus]|uniref:DUF7869 domain-containing protein n=1 Tax=Plakobranchus ocellatus TaxID=259542 RepID=A0AAV4DRG1_9GAST|nr:hypothetical protein PoB_007324000 [Plakobranchus ocellatus]
MCSMLHHFIKNFISPEVRSLELFCDGCSGQNKNYTLLHFLHFLVHTKKRFTSISLRFPIRGHSYLEWDRDMALIKQPLEQSFTAPIPISKEKFKDLQLCSASENFAVLPTTLLVSDTLDCSCAQSESENHEQF